VAKLNRVVRPERFPLQKGSLRVSQPTKLSLDARDIPIADAQTTPMLWDHWRFGEKGLRIGQRTLKCNQSFLVAAELLLHFSESFVCACHIGPAVGIIRIELHQFFPDRKGLAVELDRFLEPIGAQ
jgi:hypothetical protein